MILHKQHKPFISSFLRPRAVPFALKEAKLELDRLTKAGIIEKVDHSDWAAPVVPVPKGDGQLWLCGDYKVTINPVLVQDQNPLGIRPWQIMPAWEPNRWEHNSAQLLIKFQAI